MQSQPKSKSITLCPRCRLPTDEILTTISNELMCPRCHQHIRDVIANITKKLSNNNK